MLTRRLLLTIVCMISLTLPTLGCGSDGGESDPSDDGGETADHECQPGAGDCDERIKSCQMFIDGYECRPKDQKGCDLAGEDLSNIRLQAASMQNCDLSNANLENATITGSVLDGADLSGANLKGAVLRDSDFDQTKFVDADLSGANLQAASFSEANLTGAVLEGAELLDAGFNTANLTDADLTDVRHPESPSFTNATFSNTTCPDGSTGNSAEECGLNAFGD